jgi:heme exporter protein C
VFYPAVIGWTLLGVWIATLKIRVQLLADKTILHDKA